MKITESNCWVLLDPEGGKTISWSTWRYTDSLNSCWPYNQKCWRNPSAGYTVPQCEVSQGSCCHHKNFLLLVVGPYFSARKLLICASKLMQSPPLVFTLTSPLFNFSCFGPKSWGVSSLLGRTIPHEFILRLSKSSKSLGDGKNLSINILCPKPSTLQVKCQELRVLQSCQWSSVSLYPSIFSCRMYTLIHHRVCKFWCRDFSFLWMYCLKIILPFNFTITSSTAKCSEEL